MRRLFSLKVWIFSNQLCSITETRNTHRGRITSKPKCKMRQRLFSGGEP